MVVGTHSVVVVHLQGVVVALIHSVGTTTPCLHLTQCITFAGWENANIYVKLDEIECAFTSILPKYILSIYIIESDTATITSTQSTRTCAVKTEFN